MSYFSNIKRGIKTTSKGLGLTFKHFLAARKSKGSIDVFDDSFFGLSQGNVTLQYPHQTLIVPEIGRYQLDCEIDDCIVCDKCAKVCPVDCIDIEAIKSPELIRNTSDGSPVRLHAAKFDIDMAKCCFCGLCTTVCPTECLTMNSEYDYSVVDITQLNFAFSNLSADVANEKRELYQKFVEEKEANKVLTTLEIKSPSPQIGGFKPSFKPKMPPQNFKENITEATIEEKPKPSFIPKLKPQAIVLENEAPISDTSTPRFIPKLKPQVIVSENEASISDTATPRFVPKLKPQAIVSENEESISDTAKPKFIPKLKPQAIVSENEESISDTAKPKFAPKLKPQAIVSENEESISDTAKPKFVPKLKPKS